MVGGFTMGKENYYRVYGKRKSSKRFSPFDMNTNSFQTNLIYVSFFTGEIEKKIVEDEVASMNELNPSYIFEVRKV
jgi:hypothetical protein